MLTQAVNEWTMISFVPAEYLIKYYTCIFAKKASPAKFDNLPHKISWACSRPCYQKYAH